MVRDRGRVGRRGRCVLLTACRGVPVGAGGALGLPGGLPAATAGIKRASARPVPPSLVTAWHLTYPTKQMRGTTTAA